MDAVVKTLKTPEPGAKSPGAPVRPGIEEAKAAVRTLIAWAGDDPDRPGLLDTPNRVVKAYRELFSGYEGDPARDLARTFEDLSSYDDIVMLRDIEFISHCEHHMMAFTGRVHIAYLPKGRVVGISKLARVVDIFARRLQSQEAMISQIIGAIDSELAPLGTAVMIEAVHQCMSFRGVAKPGAVTLTTRFTGAFKDDPARQVRFMELLRAPQKTFPG